VTHSDTVSGHTLRRANIALFFLGIGSLLSQILLVREFLVSFYGNELSIGIVYAGWLVWIGIGSALGNRLIKLGQHASRYFRGLLLLAPIVTFTQILAVKFVRVFMSTTAGEFLSMAQLIVFAFILLSVGCMMWGMLFTLGARLLSSGRKDIWTGVNRAYVLESLGSVAGGLLFSFVLGSLLSTVQLVLFIALIAWNIVLWQICAEKKWTPVLFFVFSTLLYLLLLSPIRLLEHQINSYQWYLMNNKLTFVHSIDTRYQHLALLQLDNQYTVYADGRPAYNTPNTYEAEVFTHTIMVHRTDAKRVLVVGGGVNGIIYELLKYPVQKIDYLEIDPGLLPFVQPFLNVQNRQALADKRVTLARGDGRAYIQSTANRYDVILLNVGEPSTASLNRYFTEEFFQQCASRLTSRGILAFSFPSSIEYLADELKDLNASLYHTLKQSFKNVLLIPGMHAILIGSSSDTAFELRPDSLASRFKQAQIPTDYFSEYMFEELMPPDRIKFMRTALESASGVRLNTDNNPVTYYFDLLLWNRFLHESNTFIMQITASRIFIGELVCVLILILLFFVRGRFQSQRVQNSSVQQKQERTGLAIIITLVGLIGMAVQLLLLLNFQEAFGSVYEMVGAMTAAHMCGLAFGAVSISTLKNRQSSKYFLLSTLILFLGIVLALPYVLHSLLIVHSMPLTLLSTMVCGSLVGIVFSVGNQFYLTNSQSLGSVYAFDVFGSSLGALTTCSILLPVLGIHGMAGFLALLFTPAILAALFLRP